MIKVRILAREPARGARQPSGEVGAGASSGAVRVPFVDGFDGPATNGSAGDCAVGVDRAGEGVGGGHPDFGQGAGSEAEVVLDLRPVEIHPCARFQRDHPRTTRLPITNATSAP